MNKAFLFQTLIMNIESIKIHIFSLQTLSVFRSISLSEKKLVHQCSMLGKYVCLKYLSKVNVVDMLSVVNVFNIIKSIISVVKNNTK